MSEKLCLHPDPIFDAHCILKKGHPGPGGHLFATPEARIKISQGIQEPRTTTDWMKP